MYSEDVAVIRDPAGGHGAGPAVKAAVSLPPVEGVGWVEEGFDPRAVKAVVVVTSTGVVSAMPGVVAMDDWLNMVGWEALPSVVAAQAAPPPAASPEPPPRAAPAPVSAAPAPAAPAPAAPVVAAPPPAVHAASSPAPAPQPQTSPAPPPARAPEVAMPASAPPAAERGAASARPALGAARGGMGVPLVRSLAAVSVSNQSPTVTEAGGALPSTSQSPAAESVPTSTTASPARPLLASQAAPAARPLSTSTLGRAAGAVSPSTVGASVSAIPSVRPSSATPSSGPITAQSLVARGAPMPDREESPPPSVVAAPPAPAAAVAPPPAPVAAAAVAPPPAPAAPAAAAVVPPPAPVAAAAVVPPPAPAAPSVVAPPPAPVAAAAVAVVPSPAPAAAVAPPPAPAREALSSGVPSPDTPRRVRQLLTSGDVEGAATLLSHWLVAHPGDAMAMKLLQACRAQLAARPAPERQPWRTPNAVPRVNLDALASAGAQFSPMEGYILSRIDGATPVEELPLIVSECPPAALTALLEKAARAGVVEFD